MIREGMCKALVTVVGPESTRGDKQETIDLDEDTPLQKKLKNLTNAFTIGAIITAGIIFVLRVIIMSIQAANLPEDESGSAYVIRALTQSLNYMVVIAVVSIPEGLPLAVGVSLAFSVMSMHKDKLLVRKLDAPEKMGAIEEILCGKSGTITTANMKVAVMKIQGMDVNNTRKDTLLNCKLTPETLDLVKQSILYNTEARVEMDDTTYVPVGNSTEVSLLKFLQDAEIPVHLLI
jgi:magnesium-transporting ATPase (P-type)